MEFNRSVENIKFEYILINKLYYSSSNDSHKLLAKVPNVDKNLEFNSNQTYVSNNEIFRQEVHNVKGTLNFII